MFLRRSVILLAALGLAACSKPRAEESSTIASVSSTTAASAALTATATALSTDTKPAKAEPVKAEAAAKKPASSAKTIRVMLDTAGPETKVEAYRGEDVVLVVPSHVGTDWQITKRDGRLHAPATKHLAGALGPNTDAEQYTFETAHISSESSPEALVELTNKLAPKEKHTVRIALMQMH